MPNDGIYGLGKFFIDDTKENVALNLNDNLKKLTEAANQVRKDVNLDISPFKNLIDTLSNEGELKPLEAFQEKLNKAKKTRANIEMTKALTITIFRMKSLLEDLKKDIAYEKKFPTGNKKNPPTVMGKSETRIPNRQ